MLQAMNEDAHTPVSSVIRQKQRDVEKRFTPPTLRCARGVFYPGEWEEVCDNARPVCHRAVTRVYQALQTTLTRQSIFS